jgi:hypothetical protein
MTPRGDKQLEARPGMPAREFSRHDILRWRFALILNSNSVARAKAFLRKRRVWRSLNIEHGKRASEIQ